MKDMEFHYRWGWHLGASLEALWPLVSDTNRFNRATGVPPSSGTRCAKKTPASRYAIADNNCASFAWV
jgi:hypothetical protein